jgi:hypothetical protein
MPALARPNKTHRTIVFGRTGSGKTVGALHQLSGEAFDEMPWIVFDYKGDPLIRRIQDAGAREISIHKKPPEKPGLYIVRPDPQEPAATNDFLLNVWRQEETGLFFDEGFMVPQNRPYKAFDHIMTQGRSKCIPVIACYQRPAWLSQFATSQSDFFRAYHMVKAEDRARANEYMGEAKGVNGEPISVNYRLPDHFSLWYDVANDRATVLRPCPPPDEVLRAFQMRLVKKKGFWG